MEGTTGYFASKTKNFWENVSSLQLHHWKSRLCPVMLRIILLKLSFCLFEDPIKTLFNIYVELLAIFSWIFKRCLLNEMSNWIIIVGDYINAYSHRFKGD